MNSRSPQILVVDDEPDIRQLIGEILSDFDYAVTEVHDAAAARTAVRLQNFDAILLDIWMPGDDGITLLKEWHDAGFTTPVIMLSAHGSIETAVEATRYGAYDYLEKPVSVGRLEITVRNAIRNNQVPSNYTIKSKPAVRVNLVGSSSAISSLRNQIKRLSQSETNVLIIGEVGSGRQTAARLLHHDRGMDIKKFTVLNWLMKELWQQSIPDALDAAAGGTLLIRDIHAYDKYSQNQVLGLLSEVSDRRSSGDADSAPCIVATADSSIHARMEAGKLRPELFYRFNENILYVPPLRDRPEDIPELVGHLTNKFSQSGEFPYKRISTAALNFLRNHTWNGNVEELKNVLLKAIQNTGGETIDDAEIQSLLESLDAPQTDTLDEDVGVARIFSFPFREAKEHFEREYLRYHLLRSASLNEVAEVTGLHRASIFRKMQAFGIESAPGGGMKPKQNNNSGS